MFKFFLCIFLYYQNLFYNKHEKTKVFVFEKGRSLEEVVFGFLGETMDELYARCQDITSTYTAIRSHLLSPTAVNHYG